MFAYCNNNPINYFDPTGHLGKYLEHKQMDGGDGVGLIAPIVVGASAVGLLSIVILEQVVEIAGDLFDEIRERLEKSISISSKREYRSEFEEHHIAARQAAKASAAASILNEVLEEGVEDSINKVMLKTSIHRRIHTNLYYSLVNCMVVIAYNSAAGSPEKQKENVISVLGSVGAFLLSLNTLAIN